MIALARIQQAQTHLADTLSPTALVLDHALSDQLGRRVWLKGELFQHTGSFKARGALNWLRTAGPGELGGGLSGFRWQPMKAFRPCNAMSVRSCQATAGKIE